MLTVMPLSEVNDTRRREAASLLFAHLPQPERQERIEQFQSALSRTELHADTIVTAWLHECIVGIQVIEMLAGKSAALWTIRTRPGNERIAIEDALLKAAGERLRAARVKLAQCLLCPNEEAAATALVRHGFRPLTTILHLRATAHVPREPGPGMSFEAYAHCDQAVFQEALWRSFEGTFDCPELNDLRTSDEILAGHVASAPDQARWWMVRHQGQPAGVLILADSAADDHWDLAYLGILPSARRQGVGAASVAFALQQAYLAGKAGMTLIVDERNFPALRMYGRLGFESIASRQVYLWRS